MANTTTTASLYLLIILLLSLQESPAHATDAITARQPLSGKQKLVSKGGKFALGFYQPAGGPQDKWYIAIWYNKVPKVAAVWIANRETPISDPTSSELTISIDGNLVLVNKSRSPVWSSNVDPSKAVPSDIVAVLLNTGNLVLTYASTILWQSFEQSSDTWLPGMKFGRNKLTGVSSQQVSWRDYTDPFPGLFSVVMDPGVAAQYLFIWNNSQPYYTPGKFNPQTGAFKNIPEMTVMKRPNSGYSYEYVDNDEEEYFLLNVTDDNIFMRTVIDPSGQQRGMVWLQEKQEWMLYFMQPRGRCSVYSACGAFSICTEDSVPMCSCLRGFRPWSPTGWSSGNYTGGCARNVALPCSNGNLASGEEQEDRFYVIDNVRLPDGLQTYGQAVASVSDCEAACLNNCSCLAYSYNDTCSLWHTDLINFQANLDSADGDSSIFIRLPASEIPRRVKSTRRRTIILVGIVVGSISVLAVVAIFFFLRRRRRIKDLHRASDVNLMTFKYRDLQLITNNFSDKLGAGSFGSVFKGVLPDGTTAVAVKKLQGVRQGEKQFRAEMSTLGTIHHINLIRLLGFCSHGDEHRLLVYEYMPHASLDRYLFRAVSDGEDGVLLPWNTRYQIAIGVAKGLTYLHDRCRDCIIHCDIKPQNILLDASYAPKVSDFGLAKLLDRDFSRVLTTMRGTIGYLAPEWISGTAITAKADVFSYGMMLFEIISQKRNVEQGKRCVDDDFFPVLVAKKLQEGQVQTLLDDVPGTRGDVNLEELERACRVACWCVQEDERSRPAMGVVVQILEGLMEVNVPPVPRYLQLLAECVDESILSTTDPTVTK